MEELFVQTSIFLSGLKSIDKTPGSIESMEETFKIYLSLTSLPPTIFQLKILP